MIGVVLVTHGPLAQAFLQAVEHVIGRQSAFETLSIEADDDMEMRRADILAAVERADEGQGVVVVTDMFGGTPCNLAISIMEAGRIEVLAGANLPMLIKLAKSRKSGDMQRTLSEASEAGRKYINVASQVLAGT